MATDYAYGYPYCSNSLRDAAMGEAESVSRCPVCGDPIDYCQGHGQIGDPIGASILSAHDDGYHGRCDPAGCDERTEMIRATASATAQWRFWEEI